MPTLVQDVLAPQVSVLFQSLVGAGSLGRKLSAFQVILPTASGVSNEGPRSRVLVPLPAVSWPWVPAWGSLEPPRQDGENAQKTGKNGGKMGEIRPKECEPRELTKDQLAAAVDGRPPGVGWLQRARCAGRKCGRTVLSGPCRLRCATSHARACLELGCPWVKALDDLAALALILCRSSRARIRSRGRAEDER